MKKCILLSDQSCTLQVGDFAIDNRAGISRTLHRISAIRNRKGAIIGLTCRAGRAVSGSTKLLQDLVQDGASLLIIGPPGVGKTTIIRLVTSIFDMFVKLAWVTVCVYLFIFVLFLLISVLMRTIWILPLNYQVITFPLSGSLRIFLSFFTEQDMSGLNFSGSTALYPWWTFYRSWKFLPEPTSHPW